MAVAETHIDGEMAPGHGRSGLLTGGIAGPALGLLLPVLAAIGWELAVRLGWSSGRLVPPPSVVWATFAQLAQGGELQHHAAATLSRVAVGFGAGVAAGTFVGAVTGYSTSLAGFSTRRFRRCAPFPRLPGCRCSSSGSASSRRRKSP